ncbi:PASTA domain-containing protein [Mycobacterium sp. E740]|uniref:PASTA domain-containing protein n=1 Tax=Mycobacterium sp. E740 TaxID=1834149 RepID=UPI0007FC78DD|nr:PASTA domain-containing protein [Mycobacterium sp. E740]OBI78050.1 hypothetical protein A5663_21340 [Mycobacterium sp. E740]
MKKIVSYAFLSSVGIAAASVAVYGAAPAVAAPDVVGMKYSDALKEIKDSGGTAKIASRVGDKLDQGDCIVTNIWDSSFLRINTADDNEISVALNCAGEYATAQHSGTSVADPLGRAAKSKAEEEAQQQEAEELANPAVPGE